MLVSVIIPVFNRVELLQKALHSVYQQTFTDYEVIVVDDGSTDHIAEMLARQFPDVIYCYQSNQGVSAARNTGLLLAKGEYVAFLDSDDEWLPEKLAVQVALFAANPAYKICHTEEIWVRNGVRVNQMKKHQKQGGWIFQYCLPLCVMSPSSVMIHYSVFADVGRFDVTLPACEDYDLWLRISASYPVLFIEQPQIIKYGGHDDQLSRQHWGMDRYRVKALQKVLNTERLSTENQQAAIAMLVQKCQILQNGALKRGKTTEADDYQRIVAQFIN